MEKNKLKTRIAIDLDPHEQCHKPDETIPKAKNEDCHLMDYDNLHWQYIGYALIPHHESNIIYESYPYQQNSLSNRINQSSMVLKPYTASCTYNGPNISE